MAGLNLRIAFRSIALAARLREQRGQGLIICLVGMVLVAGLLALSGALGSVFGSVVTTIDGLLP